MHFVGLLWTFGEKVQNWGTRKQGVQWVCGGGGGGESSLHRCAKTRRDSFGTVVSNTNSCNQGLCLHNQCVKADGANNVVVLVHLPSHFDELV